MLGVLIPQTRDQIRHLQIGLMGGLDGSHSLHPHSARRRRVEGGDIGLEGMAKRLVEVTSEVTHQGPRTRQDRLDKQAVHISTKSLQDRGPALQVLRSGVGNRDCISNPLHLPEGCRIPLQQGLTDLTDVLNSSSIPVDLIRIALLKLGDSLRLSLKDACIFSECFPDVVLLPQLAAGGALVLHTEGEHGLHTVKDAGSLLRSLRGPICEEVGG